ADSLAPAAAGQSRRNRHIGEGSIAIVFKKMTGRLVPRRKSFQSTSIHHEDVEPAIGVVVIERDAASGSLEQILVFVLASKNSLRIQSGFPRDVDEGRVQWRKGGFGGFANRAGFLTE